MAMDRNYPLPLQTSGKTPGVESILFVDQILRCFSVDNPVLGVSQIARMLQTPKARVHRFLISLEHVGYVRRDPDSDRYSLGMGLYTLGQLAVNGAGFLERASKRAEELAQQCGYTSVIGSWMDGMLVSVRSFTPPMSLTISVHPGYRSPAYATAQGRIFLAFLSDEEVGAYLRTTPLTKLTPETITEPAELRAELAVIRNRLFAIAPDQSNLGATAIGAPVFGSQGRVLSTIALVGFSADLPRSRAEEVGAVVRAACLDLSSELGFRVPPEWQPYQTALEIHNP